MGKPAAKSDNRSGAELILRTALEIFEQEGYHGTSIRTIAGRAGISIALIYYHFASKEEILRTLMLRVTNDLLHALEAARDDAGSDPAARLAALARAHVRFHTGRQAESFVGNTELRSLGPESLTEVMAARDAISALYKDVIAEGLEDGSFHTANPAEANLAILTMCTAVAGWYRKGGSQSPEELAETFAGFALSLLGAQAAT